MNSGLPNILLVDDDPGVIQLLARVLKSVGHLRFASDGQAALQSMRTTATDLLLLDAEMPGMSGFDVLESMKGDPALADIPVIFVTAHADQAFQVAGLERGASDYIAKPIRASLLLARVKTQLRVIHLTDELQRIATIDVLTGVSNRRRFDELLQKEWQRGRRNGDPIALLRIDVDHFKLFNDRYGNSMGDECLRSVAQSLQRICRRAGDEVFRIRGKDFAILLPQTSPVGAEEIACDVLQATESLAIPHASSPTAQHVTVSLGMSYYDSTCAGWETPRPESRRGAKSTEACSTENLVLCAEKALFAAKHAGRAQGRQLAFSDVDSKSTAYEVDLQHRAQGRRSVAFMA